VLAGNLREIKKGYERNHVIVEFEGGSEFLKSEEIAEAKNYSGHAEIKLKPHGDAQKLLREAAEAATIYRFELVEPSLEEISLKPWEARIMRNILLVAKREYLEQIHGRAFIVSTVLVPLLIVALLGWSSITGRKAASGKHVAIAADNAVLANAIRRQLMDDKDAKYTVDVAASASEQERAALQKQVQNKTIDGCS